MAREYPRFLFSNPTNTKSPGPFIIHTLKPSCIFRVKKFAFNDFALESLDFLCDGRMPDEILPIKEQAKKWLTSQIISGDIKL